MEYYVYLLRSEKDGCYYVGQTQNVQRRLAQHNKGVVKSTRSRRPLQLVGYESYKSQNDARFCEYHLKHHSDQKKVFIRELEARA
jgi:putative endonuclease